MSQAELIGVLSAIFLVLCGVVAFIVNYVLTHHTAVLQSCLDSVATDLAKLEGRFDQRSKEKDEFDHRWRHDQYTNDITAINSKLWPLLKQFDHQEEEVNALRKWRHEVVDPYLPRGVDAIEARVKRLETKIFNGERH